jgi:hypothetical protein
VDFWVLAKAHQTAAIRDEAAAYEQSVIGHFDNALLPLDSSGDAK